MIWVTSRIHLLWIDSHTAWKNILSHKCYQAIINFKVQNIKFLAHLVMSLCNHALSVVCRCRQRRRLCTALLVTGLIIEASYLTNICSYAPIVYAHEILSQCDVYFLNGGHFSKFLYLALLSTWLNLEPLYLAQLCTYTGATHREEIIQLSIIFLKLWIFKKIHILLFDSLANMPRILSL